MCLGCNIHVMMQDLEEGNGSCLPHGLSILNTYTEMTTMNKWVAVLVKNLTAVSITFTKGVKITWFIAAIAIPQVGVVPGTLEKLDKMQGIQRTKTSVEQRKEALFQQQDLSGLLAEYNNIISFDPWKLGYTNLAKHEINVIDNEPFTERFWRIPPPMGDEAHAHVKEVLETGMIYPSQGPLCNAVLLVCKKDRGLHFCIDFHKLNARTKKYFCLLPLMQESIKSLAGSGYFSCLELKIGFGRLQWMRFQSNTPLLLWET